MDTKGEYYLGKIFDLKKGKASDEILLYDPADLTTHGVVVGMTGSGKTGLCVGLLEEAALNNLPALMIDPKGDITNLLLHFPELLPEDFKPWVNPDEARRNKKTIDQSAAETAEMWRKGLADWGIEPARIAELKKSASFAIYTPGSDAGIPVSILASFAAPTIPWKVNQEILRERVSGTVTAILGLVGLTDVDPVRSREHILLSNIFENAWSQGLDLDLGELILQTQNPPFPKLGVMDVNTFFPQKDRFELAMMLNNILAAPAFQTWLQGQPLDILSLLFEPDGKPRHSVFYIAHLSDAERMFFVTLLFSAIETWMRTQSGTTTLRTLVYFDEIFGYLPPIGNPPSKPPMMRMLKQARAFGVGLVLVTQNPVDVDYKALSNTGSWFIGKLQTDQDKQRLLDGLEGAMSGTIDRSGFDKMISGLGKRVFLLHNVHNKAPLVFQTRWAMNYLAGPLTRSQVPALNDLVGATYQETGKGYPSEAETAAVGTAVAGSAKTAAQRRTEREAISHAPSMAGSTTRPAVPTEVAEYFIPNNLNLAEALKASGRDYRSGASNQGILYKPVLLAQARIRFINRVYKLDHEMSRTCLVESPDKRGVIRWEDFISAPLDADWLDNEPIPDGRFSSLELPLSDGKLVKSMEKDYVDWAFRLSELKIRANEELKVYAGPQVSNAEFQQMCSEAAVQARDAELEKLSVAYDKKIQTIENQISREEREMAQDESEFSQRKMEEMGTHAQTLLGLFGKRKSRRTISSSLTKRRQTQQAQAKVKESEMAIAQFQKQINTIKKELAAAEQEISDRWEKVANRITSIPISPQKKDVFLDLYGIAWAPHFVVRVGEEKIEIKAYQQD